MRIAIIGAGAMGSLFGSMLSPVSDVYLIDPFEEHVRVINEKGLTVERTGEPPKTFRLYATTDASSIESGIDLAVIFTKSYKTREAAQTARPLLHENSLVLTLQNGLGNLDVIADEVGKNRAIAGVTSHGGTLVGPGHVRHAGKGPTYIAAASPDTPSLTPLIKTFQAAGIDTELSDNLDTLIWGKLIINVGINALAAIMRVPNGILGITPECEKIMSQAVAEAVAVAEALNIELPYPNPLEQVKIVCEKTAENHASMLQDIIRGARTEVGVINQAVVKKAEEAGLAAPCNRFLCEIIEALEATSQHRF